MEILSEYVREKGMYGVSETVAEIEVLDNNETVYVQACAVDGITYFASKISIIDIDKMSNEELSKVEDDMTIETFWSEDETVTDLKNSKYHEVYKKCEELLDKFDKDKYSE